MFHRTIRIALLTLTMGAAAACSSGGSSRPASAPPPAEHQDEHAGMGMDMKGMCPMEVEGTAVSAEDIDGGIALVFTTSTGDVAELQARVHRMAEMHRSGMMHGQGGMHDGEMAKKMAESKATVVDVEGGGRLELTTADEAAVSDLRAHARTHAEKMQSAGTCPMMDHEGAAEHEHGG